MTRDIIAASRAGMTPTQIAKAMNLRLDHVYAVLREARKRGVKGLAERSAGKPLVVEEGPRCARCGLLEPCHGHASIDEIAASRPGEQG